MRLHDIFDRWAQERPNGEFAIQGERCLDYGQALAAVNRLAGALVDAGLPVGARCAVLAKNSVDYLLLYLAASKAGVVPVPLNYRAAPPEWGHAIRDSGARMIVAGSEYLAVVDALRGELPLVDRFVALDETNAAGWQTLAELTADRPATAPDREVDDGEDLYQLYTSGTTGRPKGALLTHRAVTANMAQIAGGPHRGPAGERALVLAPMCHAGVVWTAFAPLVWGASLWIETDFDPARLVTLLDTERIGYAVLVPAVLQACLTTVPDIADRAYPDLRMILTGSAPISEATLRRVIEVFGCDVVQGYGLTETTAGVSTMTPEDTHRALSKRPDLLASVGRPLAGTEVRVVDVDDRPLPAGQVGEIAVRGPQLMAGYWHAPDATAETLRGGWLHTGDAGRLDADGYLYIHDRVKDMIVSGGENVYPRMVEQVLAEHPAVADVAVIGVPDPRWGETVKAVVVLHPGVTAGETEIIDFCRGRLGGFQRPRSVDMVDALPRNTAGKVLKRVLREPYWAGQPHQVSGV
jgi:acyl-CoA synthetase (AMP-forming)/AMP-acid ligase II